MSKEKQKEFSIKAINKMMGLAGHNINYEQLVAEQEKEDAPFYEKYTMTQKQHTKFKEWYIENYKHKFKVSKIRAEHAFSWFDFDLVLRIED